MEIAATSLGINATTNAIQRSQQSFDQQAQQVVDDTTNANDSENLAKDSVGLKEQAIVNSILFNVYKQQQEMQKQAADLTKPIS